MSFIKKTKKNQKKCNLGNKYNETQVVLLYVRFCSFLDQKSQENIETEVAFQKGSGIFISIYLGSKTRKFDIFRSFQPISKLLTVQSDF